MTRPSNYIMILVGMSASSAVVVFIFGHVIWYSDSHTYLNYANDMWLRNWNPNLSWRTPGYPTILLLTGVLLETLRGLIALQVIAGAAIPVMSYAAVSPTNARIALLVGFISLSSLTPFAFAMTVYPDQIYIAALVAVGCLLIRWMTGTASPWAPYGLSTACLVLVLGRPVGASVAAAVLGIVLMRRKARLHILAAIALFVGGYVGVNWHRPNEIPSMAGRQVFFNVYMHGLLGEDGPQITALRKYLIDFFEHEAPKRDLRIAGPPISEETYAIQFKRYENNPNAQVDAIFREPSLSYFWILLISGQSNQSDSLFLAVSIEQIKKHPVAFFEYALTNYRNLVLGPAWRFTEAGVTVEGPTLDVASPRSNDPRPHNLHRQIAEKWLQIETQGGVENAANAFFSMVYPAMLPASFLLMCIAVVGFVATPGRARTGSLVVFAVHAANVLPLAILVDPQFRYQIQSLPIAIIGAGFGVYRLVTWRDIFRRHQNNAAPNLPRVIPLGFTVVIFAGAFI